jgi:TonB-dependent receptor-like protein
VPYGVFRIKVGKPGFAPFSTSVEVRSALPVAESIQLSLASVVTKVNVSGASTLIDPDSPSAVTHIGAKQIQQRLSSLPGRSVQDLVNSQPGWLHEGNAVLHPRGSEYQTQLVIDGIPLTDNRSPGFGPEIEADDVDALSIYTAGYPAEYGRKMGGVVQLDTRQQQNGHIPNTQDQRNTLRTRFQYQLLPRLWFAAGAEYGSGLPFEYQGTKANALAEYGPLVVSRINFARGRTRPVLAINASSGMDIYKTEKAAVSFQVDGVNLNDRLNLIDFGGLFSGNAMGPARSVAMRLNTSF